MADRPESTIVREEVGRKNDFLYFSWSLVSRLDPTLAD